LIYSKVSQRFIFLFQVLYLNLCICILILPELISISEKQVHLNRADRIA